MMVSRETSSRPCAFWDDTLVDVDHARLYLVMLIALSSASKCDLCELHVLSREHSTSPEHGGSCLTTLVSPKSCENSCGIPFSAWV
mmetsp:Transcript_96274/g.171001  ORF Transcript_96274/g.171001 Transcript_96274/m.171001 type:complete len:86 (-) Transcript_96274:51-308(-)